FPNPSSAPGFYDKLGWVELRPFPLLVAPLPGAAAAFARRTAVLGVASALLGRVVAGRAAVAERHARSEPVAVEPFAEFGPWADELWSELAPQLGTCIVRDAAFLNWRFR